MPTIDFHAFIHNSAFAFATLPIGVALLGTELRYPNGEWSKSECVTNEGAPRFALGASDHCECLFPLAMCVAATHHFKDLDEYTNFSNKRWQRFLDQMFCVVSCSISIRRWQIRKIVDVVRGVSVSISAGASVNPVLGFGAYANGCCCLSTLITIQKKCYYWT